MKRAILALLAMAVVAGLVVDMTRSAAELEARRCAAASGRPVFDHDGYRCEVTP